MKSRHLIVSLLMIAIVSMSAALGWLPGQARADEPTAVAPPAAPAAAAPAPAAAAAPATPPALPGYFSATNDPAKPAWPDATGGAAGVWATPAGDGKGDTPTTVGPSDLYDRM